MVHHDCRLGDVQRQSVDGWGSYGFAVLPNAAGGPVVSLTYELKPRPGRRMPDGSGDCWRRDHPSLVTHRLHSLGLNCDHRHCD